MALFLPSSKIAAILREHFTCLAAAVFCREAACQVPRGISSGALVFFPPIPHKEKRPLKSVGNVECTVSSHYVRPHTDNWQHCVTWVCLQPVSLRPSTWSNLHAAALTRSTQITEFPSYGWKWEGQVTPPHLDVIYPLLFLRVNATVFPYTTTVTQRNSFSSFVL